MADENHIVRTPDYRAAEMGLFRSYPDDARRDWIIKEVEDLQLKNDQNYCLATILVNHLEKQYDQDGRDIISLHLAQILKERLEYRKHDYVIEFVQILGEE